MIESISISKDVPQNSALSYDFLRAEGIKHIQRLAGHTWTDHNAHDPGITILEQLCYAMTDLSYRIDNKIQDILGSDGSSTYRDLYSPATVLTVNPVTLQDIRKVVIDIKGVKNAWVEKVTPSPSRKLAPDAQAPTTEVKMKGLYRVVFENDESTAGDSKLLAKVKARLQACRGICEDFEEIKLLGTQLIRLNGIVEVGNIEDINQFVANVLIRIAAHISPKIPFYTLQTLLAKGKKVDEIFDGPALQHGFIDNEDLRRGQRKQEIHTSDLIREIMDEKEALAVHELSIATGSEPQKNWVMPLDMTKTPKLDVRGTLESLKFEKQGLKASVDLDRVIQLYQEKRDQQQFEPLPVEARDIVLPETQDRHLAHYYSIQHQFPANYGIGTLGLPDTASVTRKAQAKQLKAYLLLFEQLLANYFSQVAHVKDLLGFDGQDRRTYFNQSLWEAIPGLHEVLKSRESYEAYLEEMTADSVSGLERKNAFMNHLLARFSETLTDYGMFLFDPENNTPHSAAQKLITDKGNFLKDYPTLSSGRARAFDYTLDLGPNDNISGLEKRIARKLGVEDDSRRNLGDADTEGFHMIEHILLRPKAGDTDTDVLPPATITAFEASAQAGWTKCISPAHALRPLEEIQVKGPEAYAGMHRVDHVLADSFEIEVPFAAPGQHSPATWTRNQLHLRHLVLTAPVAAFTASSMAGQTRCEAVRHGLQEGERIEIMGTLHYNGVYTVSDITPDSFEIQQAFTVDESSARWNRSAYLTDPYSLQLSFIFPDWVARYKNETFKTFVENTLREETPAHLTIYIQWLSKSEMQVFDLSYRQFLTALHSK